MSGSARPPTRSITMNGEPRMLSSVSRKRTLGTGTSLCAPTRRMAPAWAARSYTGNTGQSFMSGLRRVTTGSLLPS
ncbi:unannotated protein [freshwater metagenome]|uniref:Unannotated protein n=1 Tax=freshwater metagenome TaxID=449393 RepID=A0A6J6EP90_9ZZZZ